MLLTLKAAHIAALATILALAGCGGENVRRADSVYGAGDCQRLELIDAEGEAIIGAEDLALDRRDGVLYISAYNRRAVEKAAKQNAPSLPQGGLYRVAIADIGAGPPALKADAVVSAEDFLGGLRPHGISFDETTRALAFINRAYERNADKWRMTPRVERVASDGGLLTGKSAPTHCAANDLWAEGDTLLTTFDHGTCDWRAGLEDAFGFHRSGVASEDGVLFNRAGLANGVVRLESGHTAIAATRQKALLVLKDGAERAMWRMKLPGGPDNLTLSPDGSIIAALHPSLIRMGLHRKLDIGRAPSRIVKVDPETGKVRLLFNDKKGVLFTAATVGVEADGMLIAGSVTDAGLLVCMKPDDRSAAQPASGL